MKRKHYGFTLMGLLLAACITLGIAVLVLQLTGCEEQSSTPVSASGVHKATAIVKPQANGLTLEQENIKNRLELENQPGAIKHFYVLSAYSGQVILYSTIKGKMTSSGKRLSPYSAGGMSPTVNSVYEGFLVDIGGQKKLTTEVLQDDGAYGSSIPYLYWWDAQGRYHQHYVSGGQILHISDQPIAAKSIIINMEVTKSNE